jgi:type I restriction enzyme M protein
MFEQTFKNIDVILHKDAGCSSELDYVEHEMSDLYESKIQNKGNAGRNGGEPIAKGF